MIKSILNFRGCFSNISASHWEQWALSKICYAFCGRSFSNAFSTVNSLSFSFCVGLFDNRPGSPWRRMIKPLPKPHISLWAKTEFINSPLPLTKSMDAPKFEVAVEFVESLTWFFTNALTVSLCPAGLVYCQLSQDVETILGGGVDLQHQTIEVVFIYDIWEIIDVHGYCRSY